MKYIMFVILTVLSVGCTRSNPLVKAGILGEAAVSEKPLEVGTCYTTGFKEELERWQHQNLRIAKIVEIGKSNYRVIYLYQDDLGKDILYFFNDTDSFDYVNRRGHVIECPVQFSGMR